MGTPGHFRGGDFSNGGNETFVYRLTFKQLKTVFTEGFRVFKIEEFFKSNFII
jgi:hypothetical protein